jgi:hypothetical protein
MAGKQFMTLNKDENVYYGMTTDGQKIRVEADVYAKAQQDNHITKEDVNDPDWWALSVADNPGVTVINEVV